MPARKQPPPAPDNRRNLRLALSIVLVGLLFVFVPAVDRRLKSSFNQRLARYAETLPAGAARVATRRLAARGLDAVEPLVQLAGSTNAAAADAARDAVMSQLAGWESDFRSHGDDAKLASRLELLATALDGWILSYEVPTRAWADRVTLNIVRDCDALPVKESATLLARCDRILEAPPAVAAAAVVAAVAATPPQAPAAPARIAALRPRPHLATQAPREPPAMTSVTAGEPLDASAPTGDLRLLGELPPPASAQVPPPPAELAASPDASLPAPREAAAGPRPRPLPAPSESAAVVDIPSPQKARLLLRRFRQMSDRELSQQLAAASGYDLRAMQQVLRERKLPTAAGPTAQATSDGSEAVEREILEQVSKLSPARGRQLLRTLATDATEDAAVRLQALALLATSGDPMLPEIARRQAVEDADPRVAELATRIMREENAATK